MKILFWYMCFCTGIVTFALILYFLGGVELYAGAHVCTPGFELVE